MPGVVANSNQTRTEALSHAPPLRRRSPAAQSDNRSRPNALIRLLQLFQTRNIVPSAVRARRLGLEYIEAEIEFAGAELPAETLRLIAAKAQELPITLAAVALP